MALVAPVNLPYNIKTLWFDPTDIALSVDDKVVVKTSRGEELGVMASDPFEVSEEEISELKTPLMPVLRVATENDLLRAKEMEEKSKVAMEVFKRLARETNEDMHPVSVEYMLDGEKAVFYFESEERIDFRELVRKLASEFHVRIDMRQIGVRDEARIVGGLAHCGQVVCCKRLGGEFKPVSIRMAKEQDMSLNPQKISGLCGRLMCCLRYESDIYSEFKKGAPKVGAQISTPDGMGKVTEIDVPKETITVRIEDEKPVKVPVSMVQDLSQDRKSGRVSDEDWNELIEEAQSAIFNTGGLFDLPKFTTEDKLGDGKAHHNESASKKTAQAKSQQNEGSSSDSRRKPRGSKRRSVKLDIGGDSKPSTESTSGGERRTASSEDGKSSHGRNKKRSGASHGSNSGNKSSGNRPSGNSGHPKGKGADQPSKLRPGHKSSGLSHDSNESESQKDSGQKKRGNRRRHRRGGSGKKQGGAHEDQNGSSN